MARQRSTWKTALGAVAVSGVALLAAAPPALAQDGGGGPDPTAASVQERVSARVLPGVDRLLVSTGGGFLVDPTGTTYFDVAPSQAGCTGFTVSSDGYIGTAGHCVDPALVESEARTQVAQTIASTQGLDVNAVARELQTWTVTANLTTPTPLPIEVQALPSTAKPGDKALDATVVDLVPFAKGDVALLKVDATNMLTVPTGPDEPAAVGTPIMAVGYPGARENAMDVSLVPTWMEGSVSSQQSQDGIAYTEISANMGHGMSGGPTVDQQGRVLGINSQFGLGDDGDRFNYVVPVSRLNAMLSSKGVNTVPGPVDTAYRAGLDDYYSGHYSDAEESFDEVLALAPGTKPAQEYKDKAVRVHDQFGDAGFDLGSLSPKTWGYLGAAVFLLLLSLGSFVTALIRRRRGPAAPTVPAPRQPGYPQQVWTSGNAPAVDGRGVQTGPASPPVGFPSPVGPSHPAVPDTTASMVTEKVVRPGGGTVAPERPRVAAGFCPRCGVARTPCARFCGTCGADDH